MNIRRYSFVLAAIGFAFSAPPADAETFRLRIASGHPIATPYAALMQDFFVPEVKKRVAARTPHQIDFVEAYGGSVVKVTETLEGVQSGIIDIGGYCFCFEPSNLPLHAFQVMLPFGTMDPVVSVKLARRIYDEVPFMSKVFEDKYKQKLIALAADNGYDITTTMEWNNVSDLKNVKISGAGLNLKWLEFAGATPVQTTLPEVYTSLQTGVYNGVILFPSAILNFKLFEVAKYYTQIGFGSVTWVGITVNSARWARLPKEVQDILLEVGKEYEALSGTFNRDAYPKHIDELGKRGAIVRKLPEKVTQDWANALAPWPAQKAKELDGLGMPGTQVLDLALKVAEDLGYKWPVRYRTK